MEAGTSPISSRKTVPVSACSNLPGLVFIAPVKAPFSNPNSSLSIRFSGMAVQLIFTNGASASGRIRGAPLDGLLQHAQQFHLDGRGHVADFIQEDRAGIGLLELARLGVHRAGEHQ